MMTKERLAEIEQIFDFNTFAPNEELNGVTGALRDLLAHARETIAGPPPTTPSGRNREQLLADLNSAMDRLKEIGESYEEYSAVMEARNILRRPQPEFIRTEQLQSIKGLSAVRSSPTLGEAALAIMAGYGSNPNYRGEHVPDAHSAILAAQTLLAELQRVEVEAGLKAIEPHIIKAP